MTGQHHLHFVQALDPLRGGGMGLAALELHKEFLSLGEASVLVSTRAADEAPIDVPGVHQFVRRGIDKTFYVPGLRSLARQLVGDSDVIHGHGFYVDPNRVMGGLAIEHGKPLVCHVHGIFEPWVLARSRAKKAVANRLFENRNRDYASLWRAVTESEVASIRAQGVDKPIVVVPNGVRLEEYPTRNRRGGAVDGKEMLLFLGRLHSKKGIDILVEAWAGLPEFHETWEVAIAGPDEDGYQSVIERLIQASDLGASVRLVGEVRGAAKVALYRDASVMVLPSRSDVISLVALEAMASGLPIVLSRECNLDDVESRGAGLLCDPTVGSVRESLRTILAMSIDDRAEMGERGRAWVESAYSWRSAAESILNATEMIPT